MRGTLTWRYSRRPTLFSRAYDLRIEYQGRGFPSIWVDDPDLALLADGRTLPHVYEQRPARLCLHFPPAKEWKTSDRIDLTIMPWADLWLLYYEAWLLTDEWEGGGVHPSGVSAPQDRAA